MTERRAPIAEAALIGIAAVWGLTFPMVQDAIAELPVMTFLAYRFLAATVLVAIVFRRDLVRLPARGWAFGGLVGVWLTAGYVFQTLGLERTSSSNAGFITGTFVVLTPVFGWLLLRQRIDARAWAAAAVALGGLYLLSAFPGSSGSGRTATVGGDLFVFACACSFALHILTTDKAVREYPVGALLVVQLLVCGVFSSIVAVGTGSLEAPEGSAVWSALIVTAVLATALGFFVQTYAQQHASPARTALILASEPAFAGLFAYLLKDEVLSGPGWAGAGLIVAAIVAVEVIPYLRPPRPLPEG